MGLERPSCLDTRPRLYSACCSKVRNKAAPGRGQVARVCPAPWQKLHTCDCFPIGSTAHARHRAGTAEVSKHKREGSSENCQRETWADCSGKPPPSRLRQLLDSRVEEARSEGRNDGAPQSCQKATSRRGRTAARPFHTASSRTSRSSPGTRRSSRRHGSTA